MPASLVLPLLLWVIASSALFLRWRLSRSFASMPPGPPGGFLGDNTKDMPPTYPWKTFKSWNERFGPVVSFFLGRTPVIVLGTAKAASELLDKRSDIYSGRPRSIMAGEILSGNMRGIGMSPGPRWRRWRSLQSSALGVTSVVQYQPLQNVESAILLRGLLGCNNSEEYRPHLSRVIMSTVFCVSYGQRIKSTTDEAVLANKEIDDYFVSISIPGKFIVESWPFLLYLPRFLQWFRHEPESRQKKEMKIYLSNMNRVKAQMELGSAPPCLATYALEKREQFGLNDVEMAYALSSPWAAGVGTTLSTIEVAILAMLHFPDVMCKAQAELDSVVGTSRLPSFDDQPSLPYIQALIKETTRWRPIAPTGIPHSVAQEDTYEGMTIPKGTTIYANIYAILADPEVFPEPDTFQPERYLGGANNKVQKMAFGFGRRVCPGMHIALQTVFIVLSRILWAFDILPVIENGKSYIPPADDFTSGLVSRPANLKYRLVPRHPGVVSLVMLDAEKADMEALAWQG